jgi:hypothetical protein
LLDKDRSVLGTSNELLSFAIMRLLEETDCIH